MGNIVIKKIKQLSNGTKLILTWVSVFFKRAAVQDITRFTLVITDAAGCVSFAKLNISKRQRAKTNAQNVMRKLRLPIKIEQCASHLHISTIK